MRVRGDYVHASDLVELVTQFRFGDLNRVSAEIRRHPAVNALGLAIAIACEQAGRIRTVGGLARHTPLDRRQLTREWQITFIGFECLTLRGFLAVLLLHQAWLVRSNQRVSWECAAAEVYSHVRTLRRIAREHLEVELSEVVTLGGAPINHALAQPVSAILKRAGRAQRPHPARTGRIGCGPALDRRAQQS